jgi:hypothetical protein
MANLTTETQTVEVAGLPASAKISVLDDGVFEQMTTNPEYLGKSAKLDGNSITLGPYAVARVAS